MGLMTVFKDAWQRAFARFTTMSWEELRTRLRQEVAKRRDAMLGRFGIHLRIHCLSAVGLHAGARLPPAPFFVAPGELVQLTALLRDKLPVESARIVEEAEQICQHRFRLLGYTNVDYGPEIDWHRDAVHGKQAPRRSWFTIKYLNFEDVGDHKVIWELNRHQQLVTLAKAYALTGQQPFVAELLHQWYHWQKENPYPVGINWASSLEVAFRSLSWLWALHLLVDCTDLPESFHRDLVQGLGLNGRHIEQYLSTYFSPNTHLLGEGVALFFIGTLCPQLAPARRWQQRGWEIVLREAERQVRPDGFHFEQSTYYHVYALDLFLHARILAARNGVPIASSFDRTIERMLEALSRLSQTGPPPRFGDDDGGRLFNPQRNLAEHMLDPLATGAVLYSRPDFKAAARALPEETLWLLGPKGAARFEELSAICPAPTSFRLESSGIHVMAGSDPVPEQMTIDGGPQGAGKAGHGHADALSVQLSVDGRDWLIDPGTLCYVSGDDERNVFRSTRAHNTLEVDGLDQADPQGPFSWRSPPSVSVERWIAGETFDLFVGSHAGYCRLPDPVIHRRLVFHLTSRFWFVHDLAHGQKAHCLSTAWHFAPGVTASQASANSEVWFTRDTAGQKEHLMILAVDGPGWSREISQGRFSPAYGREEPALVLRFSNQCPLPAEFAVLVLPCAEIVETPGVLSQLHVRMGHKVGTGRQVDQAGRSPDGGRILAGAEGSGVSAYRYESPLACHYMICGEGKGAWHLGPWKSDARFLYCGIERGGPQHWVLCGGSFVDFGDWRVVTCKQPVDRCEWNYQRAARLIGCSDESDVPRFSEQAFVALEALLDGQGYFHLLHQE